MTALDQLIPTPRLLEVDHVDLAAPPAVVWARVRHADLGDAPLTRLLFALRALPDWLAGRPIEDPRLAIDELRSTPEQPGFSVLIDAPPHEVAVGAIGRVWEPTIPFVHSADAAAFAAFALPDYAKVAWAIRVEPRGEQDCRLEVEVRVDTTDEAAWQKFRRYFRFIGIGSRFIRHSLLRTLEQQFGAPAAQEDRRPLPGDELLPDATVHDSRGITIAAPPEAIWPWLVQMGGGRAGFYSLDAFDNGGQPSARELHPEWLGTALGDILPATPESEDGFEVLRCEAPRCLVLGGLFDPEGQRQLTFTDRRPAHYWQVTWAFVLEPLDATTTRLHVRARAAFSPSERRHAAWIRPAHILMETAQLNGLRLRAEGKLPRDDWREVLSGVGGAAIMVAAFLTSWLRGVRRHWGLSAKEAARAYPGDERVPSPRWDWTHAVAIDAPAQAVWPWLAQIGADRGGFYSYQWLENLAGCELQNAERIHPEWQLREGDALRLHPRMPPLAIVDVEEGRHFVAYGAPDEAARAAGKPWAAVSWLFAIEPLGPMSCRVISRYRCATSDDVATRLSLGPTLLEPIGFAMDRRMLLGIKERVERDAS